MGRRFVGKSIGSPQFSQNARIIMTQALIASVTATIMAFEAGCSSLLKENSTEIVIVATITIAGAITQGILSAISKKCCISFYPLDFKSRHFSKNSK